jgi:hypothetical protein
VPVRGPTHTSAASATAAHTATTLITTPSAATNSTATLPSISSGATGSAVALTSSLHDAPSPHRQRGARPPTQEQRGRWRAAVSAAACDIDRDGSATFGFWLGDHVPLERESAEDLASNFPHLAAEAVEASREASRRLTRLGYKQPSKRACDNAERAYTRCYDRLHAHLRYDALAAAREAGDAAPTRALAVADDWMCDYNDYCYRICSAAAERTLRLAAERHTREDADGEPFGRPIRYVASDYQFDYSSDPNGEETWEPLPVRGAPYTDAPVVGIVPLGTRVEGWPMGWWLELPPSYAVIRLGGEARHVADRRFVQILESGPDYAHPSGDSTIDEWHFLVAERVSTSTVRHYLDLSYLNTPERQQQPACGNTASSATAPPDGDVDDDPEETFLTLSELQEALDPDGADQAEDADDAFAAADGSDEHE